jgi:anti-sigma factor RsiW
MTATPKIPAWQIERYRLSELPPDQAANVSQALAGDAESRERLEELSADDARILASHPPRVVAVAIRARMDSSSPMPSASGWRAPLLGAFAVVVCLLAVLPPAFERRALPETRIKGLAPTLFLFRESATRPEPLASPATARADDVVQLAYQAAGRRYGVVVSIDGRGQVTRHLPRTGDQAAKLLPGGPVALPAAYRLDDAPGFERFFLVTADGPFSVEVVVRATERLYGGGPDPARTGSRLDLPEKLDQFRFELRKEGSR